MKSLRDALRRRIPVWREDARELVGRHGDEVVSRVTVRRLFGGLREVRAVVCDTSSVVPESGLLIRGVPVRALAHCGAEELFYLMCAGERPGPEALGELVAELRDRRVVPDKVWRIVESLPDDLSPMRVLSIATLAMGEDSAFRKRYPENPPREALWESDFEDAMNLIARLPVLAAGMYRTRILERERIPPDPALEFAENWARMMGVAEGEGRFPAFLRRYVVLHGDHEGANASVLAARVVHSTHAEIHAALSAAMNGLAGPLHGMASRTSMEFVRSLREEFGDAPDADRVAARVEEMLASGRVIPGFGHAALRGPDPRFEVLRELGDVLCPEDPMFRIVKILARTVPPILKRQGKVRMPYPNVDAISGVLLHHFGIRDPGFFTVMFSVAQAVGLCAQLVLGRALMEPILRPRSVTTGALRSILDEKPE